MNDLAILSPDGEITPSLMACRLICLGRAHTGSREVRLVRHGNMPQCAVRRVQDTRAIPGSRFLRSIWLRSQAALLRLAEAEHELIVLFVGAHRVGIAGLREHFAFAVEHETGLQNFRLRGFRVAPVQHLRLRKA